MTSFVAPLRRGFASLLLLLVLTVIFGIAYPLLVTAIAQVPGLKSRADGSLVSSTGTTIGSGLLGQSFSDKDGNALAQYLQPRPSAAGAGYDPTATSASNLGPESIVDALPDPSVSDDAGKPSLLTQVCARSAAVGTEFGISGARPFCTSDGVGAVLAVFWSEPGYRGQITKVISVDQIAPAKPFLASYQGAAVALNTFDTDISGAQLVPIRGDAPADPAVPADAVTASASGLDSEISPEYAKLQESALAKARGTSVAEVSAVVDSFTAGRDLGFIGEPRVNVLKVNAALDAKYPKK